MPTYSEAEASNCLAAAAQELGIDAIVPTEAASSPSPRGRG